MGIVVPFDLSARLIPDAESTPTFNPFSGHLPGPHRPDIKIADRQSVERVMAAHLDLAPNGFFAARCQPRADFDAARLTMTEDGRLGEFRRAFAFLLVCCRPRVTMNRRATSYGLKHQVEHALRAVGERHVYVSNGMFLAAALTLGLKVERIYGTPNAFLAVEVKRERRS